MSAIITRTDMAWCDECVIIASLAREFGFGQDLVMLAETVRVVPDGQTMQVCGRHAVLYDDIARELDADTDLLDIALAVGLLADLEVAA